MSISGACGIHALDFLHWIGFELYDGLRESWMVGDEVRVDVVDLVDGGDVKVQQPNGEAGGAVTRLAD